mmetsp:Transcript_34626/g.44621  ORF Transcript_34626/g.44621 Transcript_34626/m.44621 type:complete len:201 (+) Transcript_34626:83-685(+)
MMPQRTWWHRPAARQFVKTDYSAATVSASRCALKRSALASTCSTMCSTISALESLWSGRPETYIMPLSLPPPVKPRSVIAASPGPFTTQPMIESVIGSAIWASRSSKVCTVAMTSKPWREQLGQEMIFTPRVRSPSDFSISKPTLTSSTGSSERDTRIVSPIPIQSRLPMPMDDFTVPIRRPPASVIPRCKGASVASASC